MNEENDVLDNVAVNGASMADLNYPMEFTFKIGTIWNDFVAQDANGTTVAYVRQKMFKLKEAVSVYNNDAKSVLLYKISADRWIDYNASYRFTIGDSETATGRVGRKRPKVTLESNLRDLRFGRQFRIHHSRGKSLGESLGCSTWRDSDR